jgi:hypothetical protein
MDYSEWTEHVRAFAETLRGLPGEIEVNLQIDPPLDDISISALADKWPEKIPDSLRHLWREGSGRVNCDYVWTPPDDELPRLNEVFKDQDAIYGGPRFAPAEQIYPGNAGIDPGDNELAGFLGAEQFALWCRSAVFLQVGNGDCLALDSASNADDPPVVYLIHDDDGSSIISRSLSEFLTAWRELAFIGPEGWLLDYWVDWDRGAIDVSKHNAAELRALLTPRPPAAKA